MSHAGVRAGSALAVLGLFACVNGSTREHPSLARAAATHVVTQPAAGDVATFIEVMVGGAAAPGGLALTAQEREQVRSLYRSGRHAPLWLEPSGRPSADARDAVAIIEAAASEGLEPADYGLQELASLAQMLERRPDPRGMAAFDVALSAGMLRYVRHLHVGRIDPHTAGFRIRSPDHQHDFANILRVAVVEGRLKGAVADLTPPFLQYGLLRTALARYRSLAANALEPVPLSSKPVRPGDAYPGLATLVRLLIDVGDLPPETRCPEGSALYDGAIVEAVRRFQARHGLDADGILGARTFAALRVPLDWRVRQIELSLERLRWLPDLSTGRVVMVNIPTFELGVRDAIGPLRTPQLEMEVIVGRALSTQTPVFAAEMGSVIFRPYWNVPRSIVANEIVPALQRNPGYLQRHDMEVVDSRSRSVPLTAESLAHLRRGQLGLRQRPGPGNALGLIKFNFPNAHDVYMHATPASELFTRSRRDFSHGCVRVEDPVALAEWLLADDPAWPPRRSWQRCTAPGPWK
jgi:murein L,D-transpeptidase YcbB/YkuD